MDKNTVTGLVIIAAILIGFTILNRPSDDQIRAQRAQDSIAHVEDSLRAVALVADQQRQDSLRVVEQLQADSIAQADSLRLDSVMRADPLAYDSIKARQEAEARIRAEMRAEEQFGMYGSFAKAAEGTDKDYIIENDKMKVTISAKGGRITSVMLKEYVTYFDSALYLMDKETSHFGMSFTEGGKTFNTNDLFFNASGNGFSVSQSDSNSISFRLPMDGSDSKYLEYTYGLAGESYHVFFDVQAVGLDQYFDPNNPKFKMHWDLKSPTKEKSLSTENRTSTVMFKYFDEKRDYLWETSADSMALEQNTMWVDFKQHFFSAFVVNEKGFLANESSVSTKMFDSKKYVKGYAADLVFPAVNNGNAKNARLEFFFGPNKFDVLEPSGRGYEEVIDFGWAIFGWVNRYMILPLFNTLEGWGLGYGWIILIITIFIKMLLLPITYKTYLSSAKMRVLRPEIEAINKKFPDKKDSMKKQQATMALYSKTGVNPLAGCIPMLIQMPILYAMFRFFPSSIELRQESFLWADDLSSYDSVLDLGFEIPLYGDHVSLFTLLMAISTIFYTRLNSGQMSMGGGAGMPNMKIMMYMFPIMMLFFFNSYSSALSYYYFLANSISIGQMWLVKNYFINEEKIRSQIEENKKKPKKKSRFAQRLEDVQKQQRAQRKK